MITVLVVILVIVIATIAILWFVKPDIFHKLLGTGKHTWEEWVIEADATCVDSGSRTRTCAVCGEIEEEDISANGHDWGEYSVTKQPTCGDGIQVHTCTVCEEDEEDTIAGSGNHTWGEWTTVTQTTCGDGKDERECSVCGDKDERIIAGSGDHNFDDNSVCTVCGFDNSSPETIISTSELSIHFIELGNKYTGDCTLIKCGNTEILIDAGSRKDSAVAIKEYVDQYCTDGVLEYVIATHAHQDHIAGFVGSASKNTRTGILYQYKIGTLIQFAGHNTTSQIYKDYCTAVEYAKNNGANVYTAKECWYETNGAKKQYYLDENQKISMNILYNYYYDNETKDENDYSVCMLLTQQTGDKTYNYLFTGDLEEKGESYLVDKNNLPEVELFKGGHHGSYTASTEKLLSVIKPKNIAVCCCCGTTEYTSNVNNTFPAQAFLDRAAKYTENIYCTSLIIDYKKNEYTSMNGNIVFYANNGKLSLYCTNNDIILKETEWFKENRTWNP